VPLTLLKMAALLVRVYHCLGVNRKLGEIADGGPPLEC